MIDGAILSAIRHRLGAELRRPEHSCRPLRVGREATGWLDDFRAARLAAFDDVFAVRDDGRVVRRGDSTTLRRAPARSIASRASLAADGLLTAWRDERYAVASAFEASPWFEIERAAARYFGIHTFAAHVNGLVRRDGRILMWIARRSPAKSIDPDRLDNLVAGGIAAGQSVAATVVKEAWEEAGIDAIVAARARPAGIVRICREQPDGLQRETIFVHDLWLPAGFVPAGQDDEVAGHRLVPLADVAALIANDDGPDVVTADAALVMLDCLLRHGAIARDAPDYATLATLRQPPDPFARSAKA